MKIEIKDTILEILSRSFKGQMGEQIVKFVGGKGVFLPTGV